MSRERTCAFAPGRVNLIGEHTDYNRGLALPFAILQGVTVRAEASPVGSPGAHTVYAHAIDLGERDEFPLAAPPPTTGWRAFVRGAVAELGRAGFPLLGARLEIGGDLNRGVGLSSSAALEVALCLALLDLGSGEESWWQEVDRLELARVCSRVENEWAGARTGLLDQLASIFGAPDRALCIDFDTLEIERVPLALDGWRLALLDSGEPRANATSGYNERRDECSRACAILGVESLRQASWDSLEALPEPLARRARHVAGENKRVRAAVAALGSGDLPAVGALLTASQASLRELYQVSTAAVETAVERMLAAGAAGARVVGGGFGGAVLGLFAPDAPPPPGSREVRPGRGAHLLRRGQGS